MDQLVVAAMGDKSGYRPATLRTRSTGGLLMTTKTTTTTASNDNEFHEVEVPSPILSSPLQGLSELNKSLVHLINQRRHSEGPVVDQTAEAETRFNESGLLPPALLGDRRAARAGSSSSSSTSSESRINTNASSAGNPTRAFPHMAENTPKSPTQASSSTLNAAGRTSLAIVRKSAVGMLRKASAEHQSSEPSSGATSPPESGTSTPRMLISGKAKPQVLETHHLQLQTHAPSGRRMINQYIIETELGRGVHGKVRLARDTETGERVAVKIVEREGKKRLGGGLGSMSRRDKGKAAERRNGSADSSTSRAHFAEPSSSPLTPRNPLGIVGALHGNSGSGDAVAATEKEKAMARKRQLWTTDKKVKREIALLKKCAHDNVVQLKEVIDDPSSKKIFMVLEFMEGGEVQWKDERGFPTLTVDEARRTLRDVVLGLEYLHYQGIIHRDIKPANLLWDANRRVKISDFGVSHFSYALLVASGGLPSQDSDEEKMKDPSLVDDHELAKTAGSPAFFAPELCLSGDTINTANSMTSAPGRPMRLEDAGVGFPWVHAGRSSPRQGTTDSPSTPSRKARPPITKAIDVWALGVTLYCLLFGHVPFMADSEFALFAAIPREDYELPVFMGADRIRVGPRKKRWSYLPQWKDEEADVDSEHDDDAQEDVDASMLCEEAHLVRDLLDRLLEKDPIKRIKLDEVKKHPWLVRDLENPPQWLVETDPAQLPFVEVSNEEVDDALTGFSKLKQTFKKIQTRLFGGLGGIPGHHQVIERGDRDLQMHGLGVGVQRQRSKSASHANPLFALSPHTSHAASVAPTAASTMPKPAPALRPTIFSRRQSTAAPEKASSTAKVVAKNDTSRSQPNSRPHSPAAAVDTKEGASDLPEGNQDQLEANRNAQPSRRPSYFFKRAGTRTDGKDDPAKLRKQPSTEASLSSAQSSRPSSKSGPLRTDATFSKSEHGGPDVRSSLESDPSHWSVVSGSQSGQTTAQNSLSDKRTRSRSRLGDVLRNVLGHHDRSQLSKPRTRPGTATSNTAPSSGRNSSRSLRPASAAFSVTPILPENKQDQEEHPQQQQKRKSIVEDSAPFLTLPADHVKGSGGLKAHSIEVDDYDVDLDLSDDDLDEEKSSEGRRSHMIMRNAGQGWILERSGGSTSHNSDDILTPSVEGGYNLFKPPNSSSVQHSADEVDETESYAMAQVHSDEAEALRRASAKETEIRTRDLSDPQHHHDTDRYADGLEDVSAMTDERFADADEDEIVFDGGGDDDEHDENGDEDDDEDDDCGVSFKARARGHS